jgi:hypothetical protein
MTSSIRAPRDDVGIDRSRQLVRGISPALHYSYVQH